MTIPTNKFLREGIKQTVSTTDTGNGALKLTTNGFDFVDQFADATNYRKPRSFEEISKSMEKLWRKSPYFAVCLTIYFRLITRTVQFFNRSKTESTQRGQGLKHEGLYRMIWIAVNHPKIFWQNVEIYISAGSWKDIFQMLQFDLMYHGWDGRVLDWDKFADLIAVGLANENTSNLIKKYLPSIVAKSKVTTNEAAAKNMIAKYLASRFFDKNNYEQYRKLKSSGTAHTWQQLISKGNFNLDFSKIHGRALFKLVNSKFISNRGLEKMYEDWLRTQPTAKFTGYIYELFSKAKSGYKNISLSAHVEETINKQFYHLVEVAKVGMTEGGTKWIAAVDTSGSMVSLVPGTRISSYDVAKSMALFFSYLCEGTFNNAWFEFNNNSKLKYWNGNTPVQKIQNDTSEAYGSTNFQSISVEFVRILKTGVPESEFPTGLVCFSDGCFNNIGQSNISNFNSFIMNLRRGGFSKEFVDNFTIVLWDIPNSYYGSNSASNKAVFEDFADRKNLIHISGLDGSVLGFLSGKGINKPIPTTSEELFQTAMEQEIFKMVTI